MGEAPPLARAEPATRIPLRRSVGQLTATHDGTSNFAILERTDRAFSYGLLVNEIGPYTGTVPLSEGPSVIVVTADGAWTLVVG